LLSDVRLDKIDAVVVHLLTSFAEFEREFIGERT
jgi:hypothetical protein